MKYVVLIDGKGEGCDYTIACNREFKVFSADTFEEVVKFIRKNVVDYYDEEQIDEYSVFAIQQDITKEVVDIFEAEKIALRTKKMKELEEEVKRKELAQLAKLKEKYEKGKS